MKNTQRTLVLLMVLLFSPVTATEMIHYNKKAVTIELQEGQERTIHFGDHVEVGITKAMQDSQLFRVQSAQGSLHVLSYRAFDKQRVQVRRLGDNQVILLDLVSVASSNNKTALEDVKIIMPYEDKVEADMSTSDTFHENIISPIDLTRYVSQKLYGPSRLFKESFGISQSNINVKGDVKIFKGKNQLTTTSNVVLAYEGGGYYISALYIKNISTQAVRLNYLDLNIPFSHATFQHHSLNRAGQNGDSTVLYLVSERPMKEALYPFSFYSNVNAKQESE